MRSFRRVWPLLVLLIAASEAPDAAAQGVSYYGGVQYATGDYIFADRTTSFSFTSGLTWSGRRLSVGATVPFIIQNTPWVTYGGVGMVPSGGPQHGHVKQGGMGRRHTPVVLPDTTSGTVSGFGDPAANIALTVLDLTPGGTSIALLAGVKAPMNHVDSGFGTGEWDLGGGASLSQRAGPVLVFLEAMYWYLGDLPDLELVDPVTGSLSIGVPLDGGRAGLLAGVTASTRVLADVDPPIAISLGGFRRVSQRVSLDAGVTAGLSESAPDFTASFGWRVRL